MNGLFTDAHSVVNACRVKANLTCHIMCISLFFCSTLLYAQDGDIAIDDVKDPGLLTIRELSEQGKHFEAIIRVEKDNSYRPLGEIIAAAKSAWALSLISHARKYWDLALSHKDCVGTERARVLLARGLMEFQERNFEQARSIAEEGTSYINESELRGELWLLIGESLRAQELFSLSETYLDKAVSESTGHRKQEAILSLAAVKKQLGKTDDARNTLTKVELSSQVTVKALTELVHIDAQKNNAQGVRTWIQEGRKSFPSEFSSSQIGFQHVRAMLSDGLLDDAEKEIQKVSREVHADDVWLQLSRSLVEEYKGSLAMKEIEK